MGGWGHGGERSSLPATGVSACLSVILAVYPLLIAVCSLVAFLHVAKHLKTVFKVFRKLNLGMYIPEKAFKVECKVLGAVLM